MDALLECRLPQFTIAFLLGLPEDTAGLKVKPWTTLVARFVNHHLNRDLFELIKKDTPTKRVDVVGFARQVRSSFHNFNKDRHKFWLGFTNKLKTDTLPTLETGQWVLGKRTFSPPITQRPGLSLPSDSYSSRKGPKTSTQKPRTRKKTGSGSEVNVTVNIKNSSDISRSKKSKVSTKKEEPKTSRKQRESWTVKKKTKKERGENDENIEPRRTRSSQSNSDFESPKIRMSQLRSRLNKSASLGLDSGVGSPETPEQSQIIKSKKRKYEVMEKIFPTYSDESEDETTPTTVEQKRMKKRQAKPKKKLKEAKTDRPSLFSSEDDSADDRTFVPATQVSVARLQNPWVETEEEKEDEKEEGEETEETPPEDEEIELGSKDTTPGLEDTTKSITPTKTPSPIVSPIVHPSTSNISPEKQKTPANSDDEHDQNIDEEVDAPDLDDDEAVAADLDAALAIEAAEAAEAAEAEAAMIDVAESQAQVDEVQCALDGDTEAIEDLKVQAQIEEVIQQTKESRRSGSFSGFVKDRPVQKGKISVKPIFKLKNVEVKLENVAKTLTASQESKRKREDDSNPQSAEDNVNDSDKAAAADAAAEEKPPQKKGKPVFTFKRSETKIAAAAAVAAADDAEVIDVEDRERLLGQSSSVPIQQDEEDSIQEVEAIIANMNKTVEKKGDDLPTVKVGKIEGEDGEELVTEENFADFVTISSSPFEAEEDPDTQNSGDPVDIMNSATWEDADFDVGTSKSSEGNFKKPH